LIEYCPSSSIFAFFKTTNSSKLFLKIYLNKDGMEQPAQRLLTATVKL